MGKISFKSLLRNEDFWIAASWSALFLAIIAFVVLLFVNLTLAMIALSIFVFTVIFGGALAVILWFAVTSWLNVFDPYRWAML